MAHLNCHCRNDSLQLFFIVNKFCLFKGVWRGILHHVINEHEWLLLSSDGSYSCKHRPLSSDRDKG